ncbi:class I SAM-dependent methyltransferase [Halovivax limisalsi]|uniref:class I SAM-dependent methyltransferase n=1 Tax=Halovivax limisalsi TaxID=1453760 RepID=UPI001FFD7BF7|nr:class I SAM-dependent methyltransferase [Halovivax limisalsi]
MTGEEMRRREEDGSGRSGDAVETPAAVVRTAAGDRSPGRALDVATGRGRNAIFLAERGWTVDAIDISRAMLDPARERASARGVSVEWILADADRYCVRSATYDLVAISFFDARDRLDGIVDGLRPGGALCYEHHLVASDARSGPGARYRFERGELRAAVDELIVERYDEDADERRVELIARAPDE